MNSATNGGASQNLPINVGTLWTMTRLGHSARCVVMAWADEWELRVLVNGEELLSERRPRGGEAFTLGEQFKARMLNRGWQQVLPNSQLQVTPTAHPLKADHHVS